MTKGDQQSKDRSSNEYTITIRAPKRYVAIGLILFLIGGMSGMAIATHQEVTPTYTGCLSSNSGQVYALAEGDDPLRDCRPGDSMVHLSGGDITAVHAGEGLVATNGEEVGDVTLAVNATALDERYQNEGEPPAPHDHNDTYVNYDEFDSVSPRMLQSGFYHGLDADSVDGHHASDFLTQPSISDYEIVISEEEYPKDTHFEIIVQEAHCSFGQVVLGGGGFIGIHSKHIDSTRPIIPDRHGGMNYGWSTSFRVDDSISFNFTATTYAICADIEGA